MLYPFMTLEDETEIVHSEILPNGQVKVYLEKPDAELCFKHATCYLPGYKWEDIYGFTSQEIEQYQDVIKSIAHLIIEFAQEGGFANASGL